ncbi:MAG: alpha/beta fold hydrolase [Rhizobiaceae bacterium]
MKFKSLIRPIAGASLFAAGLAGILYTAGSAAIARVPVVELALPADFAVERVVLKAEGEPELAGWVSPGTAKCGVVLLLHGRGSNKTAVAERARMLHGGGMSVVMFDLPGHGESGGETRGFGYQEIGAVARMADYIKARFPDRKTAAVGASLGAASLVLAQDHFKPDAYVLEELFTTLQETTAQRMRLPLLKDAQAKIMLAQLPWRLGFSADDVRPLDKMATISSPVLLLAGSDDPFVDPAQTLRIFDAISAPKQLFVFKGAKHQNLQAYDPATYKTNVLPFVQKAICKQ